MIRDWRSRLSTYTQCSATYAWRPVMVVVFLMLGAVIMLRDRMGARGSIRS
jgi:hypothetical protein